MSARTVNYLCKEQKKKSRQCQSLLTCVHDHPRACFVSSYRIFLLTRDALASCSFAAAVCTTKNYVVLARYSASMTAGAHSINTSPATAYLTPPRRSAHHVHNRKASPPYHLLCHSNSYSTFPPPLPSIATSLSFLTAVPNLSVAPRPSIPLSLSHSFTLMILLSP